ncbi:hypothetical protein NHL50_04810 [Acidimicrobiia bacterium EGI L10123]|uniref:hypothetical protein n=1 Tax=Salinilacustrithrix flava TaxID=2957203 RepID=UPI003D7C2FD7|nr:hypothetical protein [Acidimicrobiia bacterium EGI L10123]
MSTTSEADRTTIARIAAARAQALRDHAASITSDALAPLQAALHIRAGELEMAAAALGDLDPGSRRHLQAIA